MSEEATEAKTFDAKITKMGDEIAGLTLKEAVDLAISNTKEQSAKTIMDLRNDLSLVTASKHEMFQYYRSLPDILATARSTIRSNKATIISLQQRCEDARSLKSSIDVVRAALSEDQCRIDLFKIAHEILSRNTDPKSGIATMSWPKIVGDGDHVFRYVKLRDKPINPNAKTRSRERYILKKAVQILTIVKSVSVDQYIDILKILAKNWAF